jgi:glycine/D-amino acid oxidase-like deaminating enzyme
MSVLPTRIGTAIVGGGIVGMCAALELATDGAEVLVLDDGRHSGTTANAGSLHVQMQSRFIRMYPAQAAALERALPLYAQAARLWADLQDRLGPMELKATGGLMVAEDEAGYDFLARKAEREAARGLTTHMLRGEELRRIAPYLGPAVIGAELCAEEGKLNPLLANARIRAAASAAGALFRFAARVNTVEREHADFVLHTTQGILRATRVVLAAGAGTGALAAQLGLRVPTVAEPLHMNVTEATAPLVPHLLQHAERMITMKQLAAGQLVIGGGWPAVLDTAGHPAVRAASVFGNLRLAQRLVPQVARLRLIRSWAGVNTTTDGQCVLGNVPGRPGLFLAVPGDAGYTLGPLVGRAVAALVVGRDPGVDVAPFDPQRFL